MLTYIIKRTVLALMVAFTVSVLTFSLLNIAVDPAIAMAGEEGSVETIEALRIEYGYNRPLIVQYFDWFARTLHGDLGKSPYFDRDVSELIASRLPVTLTLGAFSMAFALIIAIPLGVFAAIKPNTWIDRFSLSLAVFGQALPNFWFSLVLIYILAVMFPILPVSGTKGWEYFVMPVIVLGTNAMPALMRLTRTGMLDVLSSDYIRTAWAKGLKPHKVLFKHALRNAIIPVVSVAAVQFAYMLGGSIVIETVFALHGIGNLAYQSILRADIPTMQAVILLFSSFFIVLTFMADMMNAYLDPQSRGV